LTAKSASDLPLSVIAKPAGKASSLVAAIGCLQWIDVSSGEAEIRKG
jgi:hypothetical protein